MSSGILLSGGIDSTALAWWKHPDAAYTIDYGQRCAEGEIRASRAVCAAMGIPHQVIHVDCSHLGSGDLAGNEPHQLAPATEWWPFRNQLLLTLAAMAAVQDGINKLLFGAVSTDSFHKDSTTAFFDRISELLEYQEGSIIVEAPAHSMTSAKLVQVSGIEASVLCWAHSCHTSNFACGCCRGCRKHRIVMQELGHGAY